MKFQKLIWFLGLFFAASTCFAQMYTIIDVGTLGGIWSQAMAINQSGQVVGFAATGDPDTILGNVHHAFRTAPNSGINPTTDDLGTLGGPNSEAWAINDSGQVVGWASLINDAVYPRHAHAFRTSPNSAINPSTDDLGTLGGTYSEARGINASGQVVGFSPNGGDNLWGMPIDHAFRTAANSAIDASNDDLSMFILPLGGTKSWAYGINESGLTVGSSFTIAQPSFLHAFRTVANSAINPESDFLGAIGGNWSEAHGINDSGQVVGWATISGNTNNPVHPFRSSPANSSIQVTEDLGTLGGTYAEAWAIDNYGQVVGFSLTSGDANLHLFIYSGGVMHDLNNLVQGDWSDWSEVWRASGINDAGQIVGWGRHNGNIRGFLLTPIYKAFVQQPINADGSSVFSAKRGVVPVKFAVTQYGTQPSCTLPATIGIVRASGATLAAVDESTYSMSADSGNNFRIDPTACQYVYNLAASSLGVGTYRVDISINGIMVGHAVFALK